MPDEQPDEQPDDLPDDLPARLQQVRARIDGAAGQAGRDSDAICLIAVAKTRSASEVRAMAAAGVCDIGENYLREALEKQTALTDLHLTWHFIGALQSNKTRAVAERFDWVHSVDRLRILRRLSEQRPEGLAPLNVCLQVNLDGEPSKAGLDPQAVAEVVEAALTCPNIALRGLMALPAPRSDADSQREPFRRLAALAKDLEQRCGVTLDTLSMGMSDDLEAAVAEGATHVRIGTALFGPRQSPSAQVSRNQDPNS